MLPSKCDFFGFWIGFALFLLFPVWGSILQAQHIAEPEVGVVWSPPESEFEALSQLKHFQRIGIRSIWIEEVVPIHIIDALDRFDFNIVVDMNHHYVTTTSFQEQYAQFKTHAQDLILYYKPYSRRLRTLVVFTKGSFYDPAFHLLLNQFIYDLKLDSIVTPVMSSTHVYTAGTSLPVYQYLSGVHAYDSTASGYVYESVTPEPSFFAKLQQSLQLHPTKPFFVPHHLLLDRDGNPTSHAATISSILAHPQALVDIPPLPSSPTPEWSFYIVGLLIIWAVFSIHFGFEPNYRKALKRFIYSHPFLINDILERRIRLRYTSIILAINLSLCYSLLVSITIQSKFTEAGMSLLLSKFSWLGLGSDQPLFILLSIIIPVMLFIGAINLWLYLSFKSEFKSWYQPLTLLLFPLHLVLFWTTLSVSFYFGGLDFVQEFMVIGLFLLPGLFLWVCYDIFSNTHAQISIKDHLRTWVLYSVLFLGLALSLMIFTEVFPIIKLALFL